MDAGDRWGREERANDPARVLALSDGVFAIVLTLLVLELHVPDLARGQRLTEVLREIWPSFVAFLLSFVVVAIAWTGHRGLFALIRQTDRALVWLNILYLLPISLLPFGAALISRYDQEPVALRLYGLLLIAISLTRLAIWWYATGRPRLLFAPVDARMRRIVVIGAVPALVFLVAVVLADQAPVVSLGIYAAGIVAYFVVLTFARSSASLRSVEGDRT
jgi:uncharacterized membrane protein